LSGRARENVPVLTDSNRSKSVGPTPPSLSGGFATMAKLHKQSYLSNDSFQRSTIALTLADCCAGANAEADAAKARTQAAEIFMVSVYKVRVSKMAEGSIEGVTRGRKSEGAKRPFKRERGATATTTTTTRLLASIAASG